MTKLHPVHALEANLQTARLNAIEALASRDIASSADALRDLATLQTALTAVREAIEAHGEKIGWGDSAGGLD